MRHLALIFLIPLALSAQAPTLPGRGGVAANRAGTPAPPPPPPTPAADLATLEGQVLNALGGTPLRKSTISLNRQSGGPLAPGTRINYAGSTDTSGRFVITGVEPGTYRLNAMHTGFLEGTYNARKPGGNGTPIEIGRGERKTNVVLKLTPHGVVSGKITDEDGDPVEGAQVQILRISYGQGRKQLQQVGGEQTNDLGEYRLAGVIPGKYYLSASYHRQGNMNLVMGMIAADGVPGQANVTNAANGPQEDYITNYYPGVTDISAAAPLEMGPGDQVTGINLRLAKIRTVRVRGRVTNNVASTTPTSVTAPSALPDLANLVRRPATLQVHLQQRTALRAPSNINTVVKPDGSFEFLSVPPGSYNIIAATTGANAHASFQPLDVGGSNIEGVNISINPGTAVTGHVRFETDPPQPPNLQVRLSLRTPVLGSFGVPVPPAAKVDASGNFHFDDVNPETYTVSLNAPQGYYVKSIRAGNTDALVYGLNLASGGGALDVVLGSNPPQVGGVVTNADAAQPAPAVTVVLIPQEKERLGQSYFYSSATSDQNGAFNFARVTPGEYRVYAWEDVQSGQWYDPDFMKQYEAKGESVTAREGSPVSVKVTMIPVK